MPEIMSAEWLASYLVNLSEDGYSERGLQRKIEERDSAMLEKYKEAIFNSTGKRHIDPEDGSHYLVDIPEWAKLQVCDVLDSAFAEIEGGK